MNMERSQDVDRLRGLADRWAAECNSGEFGLAVCLEDVFRDLQEWLDSRPGTLILAYDGDGAFPDLVGFFAVFAVPSFLGSQQVALEKYWYAVPNARRAGVALYREALKWAAENGCGHLILSASNLASDLHDKVCRFCERMGMTLFETAYIVKVT